MDPLMKVDTHALLQTIHHIEVEFSNYYRQDALPPWATNIVQRLDALEAQAEEPYMKQQQQQQQQQLEGGSNGNAQAQVAPIPQSRGVTLQDLSNDERVLTKFKTELELQLSSTKLALESKVSGATLELDRLHKLLQIRPTTTDMQSIVVNIHDLEAKVREAFSDVSATVKGIVQDKVSSEMTSLMQVLRQNESLSEQNYGVVMKKIDGYLEEMSGIRQDVEDRLDAVNKSVVELDDKSKIADKKIDQLKLRMEKESGNFQDSIGDIKFTQQMSADSLSEYRIGVSERLSKFNATLNDSVALVTNTVSSIEAMDKAIREKLFEASDAILQFRGVYELDLGAIRKEMEEATRAMEASSGKQTEIEQYLKSLQQNNVLTAMAQQEERINKTYSDIDQVNEKVKKLGASLQKLSKSAAATDEQLKSIPGLIDAQKQRVDKIAQENATFAASIANLVNSVADAERKLDELSTMKDDVTMIKDQTAATDARIKKIQSAFAELAGVSNDHNRRIETVISNFAQSQEQLAHKFEETRLNIVDIVSEKQGEIEGSVQNMKDQLEQISQGGGDVASMGGGGSISIMGGKRGGSAGGGVPGSAGGSVAGGSSQSVLSLSVEEQKAMSLNQAQFIADLCINFEEISVRKTQVSDIPPTMCEHITATAQALTSFIASFTDGEMVTKVIRAAPEEGEYDEEFVTNMRQQKIEEFCLDVVGIVNANNPQPGVVRLEARERFIKLLRKALQLCMSKHDQVLIVGNSSLGRVKIPTCIACDRPLVERNRHDALRDVERAFVPYFDGGPGLSPKKILPSAKGGKNLQQIKLLVPRALPDLGSQ